MTNKISTSLISSTNIKCPVCLQSYGGSIVPMVGLCGHSICFKCRTRLLQRKACPICREVRSFAKATRNYTAEELLSEAGIPTSFEEAQRDEEEQSSAESEVEDEDAGYSDDELILPGNTPLPPPSPPLFPATARDLDVMPTRLALLLSDLTRRATATFSAPTGVWGSQQLPPPLPPHLNPLLMTVPQYPLINDPFPFWPTPMNPYFPFYPPRQP